MKKDITWGSIPIIGLETDDDLNKFSFIELNNIEQSEKMKGINNPIHYINNPFKNPQIQKQIHQNNIGKKLTDETKLKISKKHIGKKATTETKIKMSETRKGIKKTKEHIQKIKNSNTGKKRTEEQKNHFSLIRLGVPQPKTSETNSKMNSLIFVCPHCQREIGGRANFIRFHNDNCKMKN
jgi:hypothetical protein